MKKLTLVAFIIAVFTACENAQKKTEDPIKKQHSIVGSQKDDHGCIVSSGEKWSELKQDCVQVFNIGFRLNPIETEEGQAVISAFVLLNDDQSKVELFLPDDPTPKVIFRKSEGIYEDKTYRYDSNKSVLYINGMQRYLGNVE